MNEQLFGFDKYLKSYVPRKKRTTTAIIGDEALIYNWKRKSCHIKNIIDDLKPSAGVETRQLSEERTRLSHRGRAEPLQLYECKRNKRPLVQIEACNSGLGPS